MYIIYISILYISFLLFAYDFSRLSYFLQQCSGKGYRRGERFEQFREIKWLIMQYALVIYI